MDRNADCRTHLELGEAPDRKLVIREWSAFFDEWFPQSGDDQIVPSPHMPHLMFEWVLKRARERWPKRTVSVEPVSGMMPTPYDRSDGGTRYVSWADWICPTHCIEPALCPAIGAPRTWEMSDTIRDLAARIGASGPALFVCKHEVFGVGMFAAQAVREGDRLVQEAGTKGEARVLVGTISSCHGALNLLRVADG